MKLGGITSSVDSEGMIVFKDNKGNKLWYFEKPFMTDASGKYSDKVTLTLRKENGKSYVDVTADKTFLEDPSTQYPVTIDPTVDSWNILKDTFISGTNPNSSYSSATSMHTGNSLPMVLPAHWLNFICLAYQVIAKFQVLHLKPIKLKWMLPMCRSI